MIEKSKRGGLTFVGAKRYAKTNNKHMGENYDSKKESSYIAYVDANTGWPQRSKIMGCARARFRVDVELMSS